MKKIRWILLITFLSFIISVIFSLLSELLMPNLNIILSVILLLFVIIIGIIFDMVGVAVTTCDITPFHSMASKKIKTASVAIKLKNNAAQVSSFCNDVIGDICGIISGSAGVYIAIKISSNLGINALVSSLIMSGLIASLTIGGKAIGKGYAIKNNVEILKIFAKSIQVFYKTK